MRRFLASLAFTVIFISLSATTTTLNFNDNWKFILGDSPEYSNNDFNDASWRTLTLPHDWSIEGRYDKSNPSGPQGGYMPCGIGWYRKSFTLPDSLRGRRFFIHFDGVYMKSQVWINGRMVGEYPNGYNAFQYDITPFVKFGAANLLAVKVDNSLQPSSRWYTGSGIYRDVSLIVTEQLHFANDGIFVTTPQVTASEATVKVQAHVTCNAYPETVFNWTDNTDLFVWTRNDKNKAKPQSANKRVSKQCTLNFALYDKTGNLVAKSSSEHTIGDFTENDFQDSMNVVNPSLWSPEAPNLYRLTCSLTCEGKLMDQRTINVGIRTFTFSPEYGMRVNGHPEKFRGVCLHQNVGCFGTAVPRDVWRARLASLKKMGCNAVRLSHYPFPAYFYDLCDSMGFYVTNEIFDEWNRGQEWGYSESSYGKMPYTYHLYFDQWAETDLTRMIHRDRNHPCVALYLLGNEIPNQRIKGIDIARHLVSIAHREDPTRPVTAACDFFVGANIYGFMDQFDIAGYNYIDRIHKDSLYTTEHKHYPKRVLLGTETYNSVGNPIWTRRTPSCIGEFIWVGFDYLGEIVWDGDRGWNEGINDIAGFPKPEYYVRKSYWSTEPVVYAGVVVPWVHKDFPWSPRPLADSWNWRQDTTLSVCVYSNCDAVQLNLNGRSLGRKTVDRDSCMAVFTGVKYSRGTLEAVGYRNGRKVAQYVLKTSEAAPSRFVAINTRGDKVDCIEIQALDSHGVLVPDYCGTASFTASGSEILGIDNGNQHDPDGNKYRSKSTGNFFNGRIRLYITHTPAATLTVTATGVKATQIKVN